jgi:PIN domain nuclease of toxin-antitoxin system
MLVGVADTHAAIWYLAANPRLSITARSFIETAASQGNQIGISSITLIEMVYLIEKGRIASESFSRLATVLDEPESVLTEIVLNVQIARMLARVDAAAVPDMPDRIIAATALWTQVPLITRDGKIQLSGLATIW